MRGPSASGKSSVAKALREKLPGGAAYIEQDYLRRTVLKEHDIPGGKNIELILQVTLYALRNGYSVILEGIFYNKHYKHMFDQLFDQHPHNNYVYYFDIPFAETLKRHATKPVANVYGEKEMRSWYADKDFLGIDSEKVISVQESLEQIVTRILTDTTMSESATQAQKA